MQEVARIMISKERHTWQKEKDKCITFEAG
jgi:hypothetical protein